MPQDSAASPVPRWLEATLVLLLAVGAVSGALSQAGHVVGDGVDMYGTFWFYWWIAECVSALQSPGFTDLMFHPLGKDIFAHTGNNFVDAVVSIPFQTAFGYPRYQPWFVAFVLALNAWSFRPLARHLFGPTWAAVGATLLWMTNPYTLFELMTGRLTQAFLCFMPLAVWLFLRAADSGRERRQRLRDGALAGVLTGLQAWTYWFMGYFMALAFAWLAVVTWRQTKGYRRDVALAWCAAGAACLATIAPAAVSMSRIASSGAVPGLSKGGSALDAPAAVANNVSTHLHGYALMELHGQPMFTTWVWGGLAICVVAFGRQRWRWVGLAVVSLVFAVGPSLPFGGADVPMPHYRLAYAALPFLDRLWFPYRLTVMAMFAVSVGAGTLFLRTRRWSRVPAWLPVAAVLALNLAEQHRHLAFPLLHRDLDPPDVYAQIGDVGGGLIELPIGLARVSIAFQPAHGQPTFGGMAENAQVFWPPGYDRRLRNTFIRYLRHTTRDPTEAKAFNVRDRDRLISEGFRWVVLDRHLVDADLHRWAYGQRASPEILDRAPFETQARITAHLGTPVMVEGALVVWDLVGDWTAPEGLRPTASSLDERSWPREDMPAYEAHLRELGRIPDEQRRSGG